MILSQGKVLINNKVIKKDDFPVGLMDVISLPEANKYYRVMPSHKGLILSPISKEESGFTLQRVENKVTVKEGMQIALHNGANMLIKVADPKNPVEVPYDTFDILKITYPDKQVATSLKTKEGNIAIITGGKTSVNKVKSLRLRKLKPKNDETP